MSAESVPCPGCGDQYQMLGQHWNFSPDHRPDFTDEQLEMLTGSMMGDGSIYFGHQNPLFKLQTISREYIEEFDSKFGVLTTGVNLEATAEYIAEQNRLSGFSPTAKEENYHDLYRVNTRTHPQLEQFAEWYDDGDKVWPDSIDLTPIVLKHYYAQDGSWVNTSSNNYIKFTLSNEGENREKINRMFERAGLPAPKWHDWVREETGHTKSEIYFSVEDSWELWEYMGDPPAGYEYKWPEALH